MTACAAQEQAGNRRVVLRSLVSRPHHEQLVQGKLGVVPVAAGDVAVLFEVRRRQELTVHDLLANPWGMAGDRIDGAFAHLLAGRVGPSFLQLVRHVHDVRRQHVLAGRCERRVMHAREHYFHDRCRR